DAGDRVAAPLHVERAVDDLAVRGDGNPTPVPHRPPHVDGDARHAAGAVEERPDRLHARVGLDAQRLSAHQPAVADELGEPADAPLRPMFLPPAEAALVRERFGTPCHVYDRAALEAAARAALAFPHAFGFTLRYAMKANSNRAVLRLFRDLGLHVDASSDPEVERALRAGFAPERIQLTSQVPSRRLEAFVALGVLCTA